MISRRLLLACILASGFTAAAAVTVVSGLWAGFTALEPWAGGAGAAGLIALALSGALLAPALLIRARREPHAGETHAAPAFLSGAWARVKARPFLTSGLGAAAVLLVILNPRYLGAILRAYLRAEKAAR